MTRNFPTVPPVSHPSPTESPTFPRSYGTGNGTRGRDEQRYHRPVIRYGNTYRHVKRVADHAGHLWPASAFVCQVCGWPVDKVVHPIHPLCEGDQP